MRIKKILSGITIFGTAILTAAVLSGCSSSSTSASVSSGKADKKTNGKIIRVAYNNTENYPHYKALAWAAEKIKEETNGRFTMMIYPNGILGDQKASLELTQNGAVDMCVANATLIEGYNSDFAVLSMPYLFDTSEQQHEAYTNGMLNDLFASTKSNGFTIVGAFGSGSRNIFSKVEVRKPEDLKGKKIRVMQSDTMITMLKLMGGTGVPMSASEQYSAIQQGVVDGAETNEIDYIGKKYYEVAPVFSRTKHCFSTDFVVCSTDFLNSLNDDDKKIFDEVMKGCVDMEFKYWDEMVDEVMKDADNLNIKWVEDVDTKAFKANFTDFQKSIADRSEMTQKVYKSIMDMEKEESANGKN